MRRALAIVVAAPILLAVAALGIGARFAHDDARSAVERAEVAESYELVSRYSSASRIEMLVREASTVSIGLESSEVDGVLSLWTARQSADTDKTWEALASELDDLPDDLADGVLEVQERLTVLRDADERSAPDEVAALIQVNLAATDAVADRAAGMILARGGVGANAIVEAHEASASLNEEAFLAARILVSVASPRAEEQYESLRQTSDDHLADLRRSVDPVGAQQLAAVDGSAGATAWARVRSATAEVIAGEPPLGTAEVLSLAVEASEFQSAMSAFARDITERYASAARSDGEAAELTRNLLLAAGGLGLIVTTSLAWMLARSLSGRLNRMARVAERISEGELDSEPLELSGSDELAQLGRAMDEMQSTLRIAHEQLGALAAGAEQQISPDDLPGSIGRAMRVAIRRVGRTTADLRRRATHDSLTGLLDREGLHAAIGEVDDVSGLGVLLVDLDGFKDVNDRHGHDIGDAVLITVARRLETVTRSDDDLVARLGGDEFVIIVAEPEGPARMAKVADRVVSGTAEPMLIGELEVGVGASVGWTVVQDDELFADALRRADRGMYRAKHEGKSRAVQAG